MAKHAGLDCFTILLGKNVDASVKTGLPVDKGRRSAAPTRCQTGLPARTERGSSLGAARVGLDVAQATRGCKLRAKNQKMTNHIQGGKTWLLESLSLS
jgi:hypothetical protein